MLTQNRKTFAVLTLALSILFAGRRHGPRFLWIRNFNRFLQRFQPWQIIGATLTILYAARHTDKLLGLNSPDYLPGYLYAREFNRATWIVTGLDAGFATAATIKQKWLRDIASMVFSVYYFFHHDEADNKLARFREVCTLDMLRITWDKLNNPYLRLVSVISRVSVPIHRELTVTRPETSAYTRPVTCWIYFDGSEAELAQQSELVLDFPGGGFVAMGPTHHEDRLRQWTKSMKRPVISVDYGKAPEYPYPYAIDEGFDLYSELIRSNGRIVGMSGEKLKIILSGDSAGGNIAVNVMLKIIESARQSPPIVLPKPVGLAISYGALNFSFSAWAWPSGSKPFSDHEGAHRIENLVEPHIGLRFVSDPKKANIGLTRESISTMNSTVHQQANLGLFARQQFDKRNRIQASASEEKLKENAEDDEEDGWSNIKARRRSNSFSHGARPVIDEETGLLTDSLALSMNSGTGFSNDGSILALDTKLTRRRSRSNSFDSLQRKFNAAQLKKSPLENKMQVAQTAAEPRLTLASKTGYLHDRILSPTMMWSMCLLYLGSRYTPGVENDFHLSPVLAPSDLLAEFPPVFLQCGGRDPLVDDTVMFGGRIREAKRIKKEEKKKADAAQRGRKESMAGMKKYSAMWGANGKAWSSSGQQLPEVKGYMISSPAAKGRNNSMIAPFSPMAAIRSTDSFSRMSFSKLTPPVVTDTVQTASPESGLDDDQSEGSSTSDENFAANSNEGVSMQIFPGWSHGYLQMAPIMPEARAAIDDISDWMSTVFDHHRVHVEDKERTAARLKRSNSFYC